MSDDQEESPEETVKRIWNGPEGERQAHKAALEAMTGGEHVNRFFVFEVDGQYEMAFGNFRAMRVSDDEVISTVQFPIGLKMDRSLAMALRDLLNKMLPQDDDAEKDDG